MILIGLTGGTGGGKSAVSEILAQNGGLILDADKLARKVVEKGEPAYLEIKEHFGEDIFDENGDLIRKKLGDIVFNDPKELEFLNKCTHKYIAELTKKELAEADPDKYRFVVFDAPQLIESGMDKMCDKIWVVTADEEVRIKRIMERDSITRQQAQSRIDSQLKLEDFEKVADRIIFNNGSLEELKEQVEDVLSDIKD
ncbi:MAG: dephospho-CoA kinase [Firmicutes bacterium]|nr:dephospho-CoA kinase [Bacillota bacterium]